MAEDLTFNILARDGASRSFKSVGDAALGASGKIDLAAASLKLWDDTSIKQGKAANTSTNAMKTHAAAAKLLADAENVLAGKATVTTKLMADQGRELDRATKSTASLAEAAAGAAPNLAGMVTPLGAAVGAGVALAPVLATIGVGLAGLAAAAYGVAKPIENAAQKTGGLQANLKLLDPEQRTVAQGLLALGAQYQRFQKALQPVVLGDFNRGLVLASHLLGDVEPVAAATGKALGGFLNQIDAEFRSNNWQNFFQFMARSAGPDIRLLGNAFVSLTQDLPPLLEALQPVAQGLLQITTYTGQAIRLTELASTNFQDLGKATQKSGGGFNALTTGAKAAIPGMEAVNGFAKELGQGLDILYGNSKPAAKGIENTGAKAHAAAMYVFNMKDAVTQLTNAESKSLDTQLAYSNSLIQTRNDADSLRKALKASHDQIGLHTAAERASFSAANTYIADLEQTAKQSWASGHGTDGASSAIRRALPLLDSVKTKSKLYWEEVRTLKQWLDRLAAEKTISERIKVYGTGNWTTIGPGGMARAPAAAGMLVQGGTPNRDSVPIMAMPGEAVVPKRLVPAVAPFLSANKVPGFAGGGIIPTYSGSVGGLKPWAQHNDQATLQAITSGIAKSLAQIASSALGGVAPASGSAAAAQRYAASLLTMYGWSQAQMSSLIPLWNRESGWNANAVNPTSGAYGIPQALPAVWGHPYALGDYRNQVIWGLNYIKQRPGYGSPAAAWAHELAYGWYDKGGWLPPGVSLAVNKTGYPEQVVPRGGRGGGDTYNVTVNVPPTVNPREAGRQVAELIIHHTRGGGRLYPAGMTPR